ncbi:MAG: iron-containing alcohol dehydrogenase [Clostridiales Family XIII bacterium]|nr:iron-containing alcohol dehydrogenase [Clostridiales Family XIII bacterium]
MKPRFIGYRAFQAAFNIGARAFPWRKAALVEGAGSIARIPELLAAEGVRRPLIVAGPVLTRTGLAGKITGILESAGVAYSFFGETEPDPSVETVNKIAEIYRREDCGGFIAIGGGSSMDAAKGAAALIARSNKTVSQLGGLLKVRRDIPPFIAVPTTAGTGSETTIAAVITDTNTHHKYAIMDLKLIPKYAILDPDLTTGLPPHITAITGMDALTHAVEAYLCWTYNTKESTAFALDAVRRIFGNLEKAYRDGSDRDARLEMMRASYQAGFAFTRAGVGNVHALAHTLGGLYHTAHGLANAVILPIVLDDYGEKVFPKLARLAASAGVARGVSDEEDAKLFTSAIRGLNDRMGIPRGFDFIKEEDIPQMINWALKEANPLYPVPVIYDRERCGKVIESVRL